MDRSIAFLIVGLLVLTVGAAPMATAAPEGPPAPPEGEVCTDLVTLCCYLYDDGDLTPAIYCM